MMDIIPELSVLILGLIFLTKGADWLIEGAADVARYLKVSPILVGLTVVSVGTSLPEFVVSLMAALSGNPDLILGNIVGSNIANIGLILGISALIYPLIVHSSTLMFEFPFLIISTFLFVVLANNQYMFGLETLSIDRVDGFALFIIFVVFLIYIYKKGSKERNSALEEFKKEFSHQNSLRKNIFLILLGSTLLATGGRLSVNGAVDLAQIFGLSESFVGLTIIAIGTSLPELFASGMAAYKKEADIAVGNVVGSCLFNIVFVISIVSLITPIQVQASILFTDAMIMIIFTTLLLLFASVRQMVSRKEGGLLLGLYVSYIVYLILTV